MRSMGTVVSYSIQPSFDPALSHLTDDDVPTCEHADLDYETLARVHTTGLTTNMQVALEEHGRQSLNFLGAPLRNGGGGEGS